jgi:hypothetical protein
MASTHLSPEAHSTDSTDQNGNSKDTRTWIETQMETEKNFKLYARFKPIREDVIRFLGMTGDPVPPQSPTEIEEYGPDQLIVTFTSTSVRVTVEGGRNNGYIVWLEREVGRAQAHHLIEAMGPCWYDEWEVPL